MSYDLDKLQAVIMDIGHKMVACTRKCDGVDLAPEQGKIPRALRLEVNGRDARGIIVVGLNPGRANRYERNYYVKSGRTYRDVVAFWTETGKPQSHPYHRRIRELVGAWGFTGPILWSELAKCQTKESVQALPLQTFRTCVSQFLRKELALIPGDWPILAAGQEAYKAVSYMFPDRAVIGVPHPTGARLNKDQRSWPEPEDAKAFVNGLQSESHPGTVWLQPNGMRTTRWAKKRVVLTANRRLVSATT